MQIICHSVQRKCGGKLTDFYRYDGTDGSNARGNICTDFYDRHVSDDESDDRSFRLFHFTDESIRLPQKGDTKTLSGWEFLCDSAGSGDLRSTGKMEHGSGVSVLHCKCCYRYGLKVHAADIYHDLWWNLVMLHSDQFLIGRQIE